MPFHKNGREHLTKVDTISIGDFFAVEPNLSLGGQVQPGQTLDQGGLAAAVTACDEHDLARSQCQINRPELKGGASVAEVLIGDSGQLNGLQSLAGTRLRLSFGLVNHQSECFNFRDRDAGHTERRQPAENTVERVGQIQNRQHLPRECRRANRPEQRPYEEQQSDADEQEQSAPTVCKPLDALTANQRMIARADAS